MNLNIFLDSVNELVKIHNRKYNVNLIIDYVKHCVCGVSIENILITDNVIFRKSLDLIGYENQTLLGFYLDLAELLNDKDHLSFIKEHLEDQDLKSPRSISKSINNSEYDIDYKNVYEIITMDSQFLASTYLTLKHSVSKEDLKVKDLGEYNKAIISYFEKSKPNRDLNNYFPSIMNTRLDYNDYPLLPSIIIKDKGEKVEYFHYKHCDPETMTLSDYFISIDKKITKEVDKEFIIDFFDNELYHKYEDDPEQEFFIYKYKDYLFIGGYINTVERYYLGTPSQRRSRVYLMKILKSKKTDYELNIIYDKILDDIENWADLNSVPENQLIGFSRFFQYFKDHFDESIDDKLLGPSLDEMFTYRQVLELETGKEQLLN